MKANFTTTWALAGVDAGLKRGFVDDARRAATPHVIDCVGLSRKNLGDEPYRFEGEFHERRAWCDESGGLYEIEAIRDDETRTVTGFRFRFAGFQRRVFQAGIRYEPLTITPLINQNLNPTSA